VDERDVRGGEKVWQWVRKGVPLRLEIGPRDMEKDSVFAGRRGIHVVFSASSFTFSPSDRRCTPAVTTRSPVRMPSAT